MVFHQQNNGTKILFIVREVIININLTRDKQVFLNVLEKFLNKQSELSDSNLN